LIINNSVSRTYTKDDIGLGNVDNTSDADKPISTAVQTALNSKANSSHTHSNYVPTTRTINGKALSDNVTLSLGDMYTWNQIATLANLGLAESIFYLGFEKDVTLTTGETLTMQIWGFDHDAKNSITFGAKNLMASTRTMNSSNTNVNGWSSSAMRTWLNGDFYNSLPENVKSVITEVSKKTCTGNKSTTINTTTDKIFLPAQVEVYGSAPYSLTNEGSQYAIFKNAGVTTSSYSALIKNLANGSGSAYDWWLRSPYSSNTTGFCIVYSSGNYTNSTAGNSYGVCPCFVVG
jgi:hypothetical protein